MKLKKVFPLISMMNIEIENFNLRSKIYFIKIEEKFGKIIPFSKNCLETSIYCTDIENGN